MSQENEPVIIQAIMLSDMVVREAGTNKLSLIGVFALWNAQTFPFASPPFFITPFMSNFRGGASPLPLVINIERPDKSIVWSMSGNIGFAAPEVPPHALIEAPIRVQGVTFPAPGRYTIRVLVDGEDIGYRDFHVFSATSGSPPHAIQ